MKKLKTISSAQNSILSHKTCVKIQNIEGTFSFFVMKNHSNTVRFMKKSPLFAPIAIQSGHRNWNPAPPTPICTAQA